MESVVLNDDLYLGKGVHRAAYIDPRDPQKCIKILFHEQDREWQRELRYRNSRKRRHLRSKLITEYYGTVPTNLGTGYVFERIVDWNGQSSMELWDFLRKYKKAEGEAQQNAVFLLGNVLLQLRDTFFQEKIVVSNMHYGNLLLQQRSADPDDLVARIIDNIGCSSHLPLVFYIDFLALRRCRKYWNELVRDIKTDYPQMMPDALSNKLFV